MIIQKAGAGRQIALADASQSTCGAPSPTDEPEQRRAEGRDIQPLSGRRMLGPASSPTVAAAGLGRRLRAG